MRSPRGASAALLRAAREGRFEMLATANFFFEYDAVMTRAEHLQAAGLSLPEGVHREVERLTLESGVSPAQFLASAAAEKVSAMLDPDAYFAACADDVAFDRIMSLEGGEPPRPGDEVD